jgi:hypothetical protein
MTGRQFPWMTKQRRAALLREYTTQELRSELQKRERKSWQRHVLDNLLATLSEREIRAVLARMERRPVKQPPLLQRRKEAAE